MSSNSSPQTETLSGIWQRVLGRTPLTPADNFFDLGGNLPLACKLFDEITRVLGPELPPTILYDVPTLGALADLLGRPSVPYLPPLVTLKPGTGTPIFIFHGLGSSILEFYKLIKQVRTTRPIYGLQAQGSDGADTPATRIRDMARFRLRSIRSVQAHGPYTLVGYSLGGVIALEIARRLAASGEEIDLLVMIDSYPYESTPTVRKRARLLRLQLAYRLRDVVRSFEREKRRRPLTAVEERARISDTLALSRYRPRFYGGKVIFVRAQQSGWPDPVPIWAPLVRELTLEQVPGDHHTILSLYSENLGSLLSRHFESSPQLESVR